jgi:FkbM family methyltransferase
MRSRQIEQKAKAVTNVSDTSKTSLGRYSSLRHRLRSSFIRRLYWSVAKRETLVARRQEEEFYRKLLVGLKHDDLIFDIGANMGEKTDVFLKLGARVLSVEPDGACRAVLKDRFLQYRLRPRPVTLVGKAVSDKIGTEQMWIDGPGSAVNTISRKWADELKEHKQEFKHGHCGLDFSRSEQVDTTTVEELIRLHGTPYFIKIDVEGHELSVLRGLQRPVPFLSFEVNLRAFREEGMECVQLLHRLHQIGCFNYTPDCASGLVLKEWLGSDDFQAVLHSCTDESIEVFWKTNCNVARPTLSGDQP